MTQHSPMVSFLRLQRQPLAWRRARIATHAKPLALPPFPAEEPVAMATWADLVQSTLPSLKLRVLVPPAPCLAQTPAADSTASVGIDVGDFGGSSGSGTRPCRSQSSPPVVVALGVRHDCAEAAADVAALISALRPQQVGVELCRRRFKRLFPFGVDAFEGLDKSAKQALRDKLKRGGEQLEASLAARRVNADLVLCDRDVRTTEARLLDRLSADAIIASSRDVLSLPDLRTTLAWLYLGWRLRQICLRGGSSAITAPAWAAGVLPESFLSELSIEASALHNDPSLLPAERWIRMQSRLEVAATEVPARLASEAAVANEADVEAAVKSVVIEERDDILCDQLWQLPGPLCVVVLGVAHLDGLEHRWADRVSALPCDVSEEALKASLGICRERVEEFLRFPRLPMWRRIFGRPLIWRLRGTLQ